MQYFVCRRQIGIQFCLQLCHAHDGRGKCLLSTMADSDSGDPQCMTCDSGSVIVKNVPMVKPGNDANEENKQKWESFRKEFESKFLKYRGSPRFFYRDNGEVNITYGYSYYARKAIRHLHRRELFSDVVGKFVLECEFSHRYFSN